MLLLGSSNQLSIPPKPQTHVNRLDMVIQLGEERSEDILMKHEGTLKECIIVYEPQR